MTPPSGECSYRQSGMQAGVLDLAEELKALPPLLAGNGHFFTAGVVLDAAHFTLKRIVPTGAGPSIIEGLPA